MEKQSERGAKKQTMDKTFDRQKIYYHVSGKDPLYKIWHASEEHMFLFMHSSGGSIVCREKIYPIEKGCLCFIAAGKVHYTMPDNPGQYERSKFFLSRDALQRFLGCLKEANTLVEITEETFLYAKIPPAEWETVEQLYARLYAFRENGEWMEPMAAAACLQLFLYLKQGLRESVTEVCTPFSRAIAYINRNFTWDITLEQICREVSMSKSYFCRCFKQRFGITVMEYVQDTRLTYAKDLLRKGQLPVSEVSLRSGFGSIPYFCRIFKKHTGMTPLAYARSAGTTSNRHDYSEKHR